MLYLLVCICIFMGFYNLARRDGQNKVSSVFHGCWWAIIWPIWLVSVILLKILCPNTKLEV